MKTKNTSWGNRTVTKEFSRNREIVRLRDRGFCVRCEVLENRLVLGRDVDHHVPVSKGGSDNLDNLGLLCKVCHRGKTARESNGYQGFPLKYDLSGWPVEDHEWPKIYKERTINYFNERGWKLPDYIEEERVN